MKSNFDRTKIGKAPSGYLPGISRGCHGFITRSDIGPMMADITTLARDSMLAQQVGPPVTHQKDRERHREQDPDSGNYNDTHFDTWGGFQNVKLFQNHEYDDEDREADEIYQAIDKYAFNYSSYVDSKRGPQREAKVQKEAELLKKNNPEPQELMKDVLKEISHMSKQDWINIPDIDNRKFKKNKREDRYTPVPDSLITDRLKQNSLQAALDQTGMRATNGSGVASVMAGNLSALGDARRTILGLSLDHVSDGVNGKGVLDKAGYMTSLQTSMRNFTQNDIHDVMKARQLYKSLVDTQPHMPRNWLGYSRTEENAGQIETARNIIAQGIEACPDSEDIWLEAIRLEPSSNQKSLVVKAVKFCPKSAKLWLLAAKLEGSDKDRKVKVLKKGLEHVPQSEKIWLELVDLSSSDEEAKELLKHAIECVPDNIDFRLALARLCPYAEAKEVINKANRYFKSEERVIWIHASKLEEANGNADKCEILISRGISTIAKKKRVFEREEWIDEAQECEKAGCLATCTAIIKSVYELDAKEQEFVNTWREDASLAIQRGNKETAKLIYERAVAICPTDKKLWEDYITFVQRSGNLENYKEILNRAARVSGSTSQQFLLRLSKEFIKAGDVTRSKELLKGAIQSSPESEELRLAYAEILKQLKDFEIARHVIKKAEEDINSIDIWQYHVKFERDIGEINLALSVAQEAVQKFPYNVDLGCTLSAIYEDLNMFEKAKEGYISMTKHPKCQRQPKPWIQYMLMEEKIAGPQKARTIYELSKQFMIHQDPEMWYQILKLEQRANTDFKAFKAMLAQAVKECPKNGELRAMMVENEPRAGRIRAVQSALEECSNDPYLMNVTAVIFWFDLKREKAGSWFERSLLANLKLGDTWAYYYVLHQDAKDEAKMAEVQRRCFEAEPSQGRIWKSIADRPMNWNISSEKLLILVAHEVKNHLMTIRR